MADEKDSDPLYYKDQHEESQETEVKSKLSLFVVGSASDETVIQELSRAVRSLGWDLDHVAADVLSIKDMLNQIGKDEEMKLQLLPIKRELAEVTERLQKHFVGNKEDMDLLKSDVEAIKVQLQEMQKARTNDQNIHNIALEQTVLRSPSKVKSDADRSKRRSFGEQFSFGEIVDKVKGKVEEKFSKTSSQQDKQKDRVFFESLKELLENQLSQEQSMQRFATGISRNRSSTKGSDSGFSSSLTSTSLPRGYSSQTSNMSTSSSDTSLAREGTHPPPTSMVTDASVINNENQTQTLSSVKEEVEKGTPSSPIRMPERTPSDYFQSTPFSPTDRDAAFLDNYESLSIRFDGFLSGLLDIVNAHLNSS